MNGTPAAAPFWRSEAKRTTLRVRKTIRMPEWKAKLLRVGADAGRSENGYLIEKIGEPFTDKNGRQMVRITIVEHPTQ